MLALAQDWVAAALAIAAATWLARRVWRARRRTGACAGCEHCPMAGVPREAITPSFVPLSSLSRSE
jgi:sulfite reductase beta subunit-like hemoprotein